MTDSNVEAAVRALPGWSSRRLVIETAIPVLASPSWRGVDGAPIQARDLDTDETVFVKKLHKDALWYVDAAVSFDAAIKAGEIGVGPKVLAADLARMILITEDLSAEWRVAGLERTASPDFIDAALAARARFAEVAPLARRISVFDDIEAFYAKARTVNAQAPTDLPYLVETVLMMREAAEAGAQTLVPTHGDGTLSNVLVAADGRVKLVDWDRAAMADPMEDIGAALQEMCAFEPEMRDAFARRFGAVDEVQFARARIFGVADDLRWGLIAALQATLSPRRDSLEFYKFACWRFLRCRMSLRDPRASERMRRAAA